MFLKSSTIKVTMTARIIITMESNSKSLKSVSAAASVGARRSPLATSAPPFYKAPRRGYVNRKVSLPGEGQLPTVFWQAPAWYSMQIHHNRKCGALQLKRAGFCLAVRALAYALRAVRPRPGFSPRLTPVSGRAFLKKGAQKTFIRLRACGSPART